MSEGGERGGEGFLAMKVPRAVVPDGLTVIEIARCDGERLRIEVKGSVDVAAVVRGVRACTDMMQLTPQMRILVAVEPADFRAGIDGFLSALPGCARSRPILGERVRVQKPWRHGDQDFGVRRAGVLAVSQTDIVGEISVLASST